jgi:hypothetical protein
MEKIVKIKAKQVCFEIPIDWHKHIKQQCLDNNLKLKDWLAAAIGERVKKERKL